MHGKLLPCWVLPTWSIWFPRVKSPSYIQPFSLGSLLFSCTGCLFSLLHFNGSRYDGRGFLNSFWKILNFLLLALFLYFNTIFFMCFNLYVCERIYFFENTLISTGIYIVVSFTNFSSCYLSNQLVLFPLIMFICYFFFIVNLWWNGGLVFLVIEPSYSAEWDWGAQKRTQTHEQVYMHIKLPIVHVLFDASNLPRNSLRTKIKK